MKIIYILVRIETSSGVLKKIRSQIDNLINLGIDVTLVVGYGDAQSVSSKVKFEEIFHGLSVKFCKVEYDSRFNFINKLKYLKQFYRDLERYGQKIKPDFYYYRGLTAERNLLKFLKKHPGRVIFEINTIIRQEYKLRKAYDKLILNLVYMKKILNNAAACITVTNEIAESLKQVTGEELLTKTISNGVDVKSFPLITQRKNKGKELNLIFVGNIAEWHGLDRVIRGLIEYRGEYKIDFFIVGDSPLCEEYKILARSCPENVDITFTGLLFDTDLDLIFDKCDIAIASLGLHRINLKEGSILKTREYLSRGLPLILAYTDIDIEGQTDIQPYVFRVPADESNINLGSLVQFYKSLQSIGDYKKVIRAYAEGKVDMNLKMLELMRFLDGLSSIKPINKCKN